MKLRINIIIIAVLALQRCAPTEPETPLVKADMETTLIEESFLIEAQELIKIIDRPNIKLVDFRKEAPYALEHIPDAVNIGRSHVQNDNFDYNGMMASKDQMEILLGDLGISSEDTLVVYDDNGLCNAARLWWILQNYDFDQLKLLHGGLTSWKTAGGKVTTNIPNPEKSVFKLTDNPSMKFYISKEDVQANIGLNTTIIDTRTADEYSGKRQKNGALKGGRIPGGINIDWAEAINHNGDKKMRSNEELLDIYGKLNLADDEPVIVYCHTGMRSAHTTFVLTQLIGHLNVKNYDGSWTEWSRFDELPFEQDTLTVIQ